MACDSCSDVAASYRDALEAAKACDPEAPDQCNQRLPSLGLSCCETFIQDADAVRELEGYAETSTAMDCGFTAACAECAPPSSAYCSAEGRCEDVFASDTGAACKVGDVTYPHGATGIDDPTSCNDCDCNDGQLACTEINCPEDPCPEGTGAGTQCAQCGPADECEVVEYGCFPTCEEASEQCPGGFCLDGLCRDVCG
jgi:hypothetical protein